MDDSEAMDDIDRKFDELMANRCPAPGRYYVLDDNDFPVPCDDLLVWARWFEHADEQRKFRRTETKRYTVCTSFLGVNHQFGDGPPLVWETMICYPSKSEFGCDWCDYQERYSTPGSAIIGHIRAEQWAERHFSWHQRLWRWLKGWTRKRG